jgi:hypothetical protein
MLIGVGGRSSRIGHRVGWRIFLVLAASILRLAGRLLIPLPGLLLVWIFRSCGGIVNCRRSRRIRISINISITIPVRSHRVAGLRSRARVSVRTAGGVPAIVPIAAIAARVAAIAAGEAAIAAAIAAHRHRTAGQEQQCRHQE